VETLTHLLCGFGGALQLKFKCFNFRGIKTRVRQVQIGHPSPQRPHPLSLCRRAGLRLGLCDAHSTWSAHRSHTVGGMTRARHMRHHRSLSASRAGADGMHPPAGRLGGLTHRPCAVGSLTRSPHTDALAHWRRTREVSSRAPRHDGPPAGPLRKSSGGPGETDSESERTS
jgi:hypothetical protein